MSHLEAGIAPERIDRMMNDLISKLVNRLYKQAMTQVPTHGQEIVPSAVPLRIQLYESMIILNVQLTDERNREVINSEKGGSH